MQPTLLTVGSVVRQVAGLVGVYLELIAAHIEVRQLRCPVIDAGIATHKAKAKVEFKVRYVGVMPEQTAAVTGSLLLTVDHSVTHRPDGGIEIPAFEVNTIEEI